MIVLHTYQPYTIHLSSVIQTRIYRVITQQQVQFCVTHASVMHIHVTYNSYIQVNHIRIASISDMPLMLDM